MKWVFPWWAWVACGAPLDGAPDGPMSFPPDDFYPGLDVPYVPTPAPVIDKMLGLTAPRAGEVLMDLGCGDGRIVLTALQRVPGLTGVGVDLDPARIREANAGAERLGLTERVRFLEQNLFETPIQADVVTLYLLPEVNVALRPALFSELAPGARVASHDFDMEDWAPDTFVSVGRHRVYFWVIPEALGGTWVIETDHAHLPRGRELELMQGFQRLVGTDPDGEVYLRGHIDGRELDATVQPRSGEAGRLIARVVDTERGQRLEGLYDLVPFSARRLTMATIHMERVDSEAREL